MKVLVADDDNTTRSLIDRLLRSWGYSTVCASSGVEALERLLQPDAPMMAVLDWMMPGLDGTEVTQQLRSQRKNSYTYVVLVTAKSDKADYLRALAYGIDDFLSKPLDAQELKARLHVGQRILTLQKGLIDALHKAQFQASHDDLTGLLNRKSLLEDLETELARAQRHPVSLSLILADVDHFKSVNDRYGHLAGDFVLREIARRMRSCLRSYDKLGRFGGEEFLAFLPDTNVADAFCVAERMRTAVEGEPIQTDAGPVSVSISLGISEALRSADASIHAADAALYRAKAAGRNRTVSISVLDDVPAAVAPDHLAGGGTDLTYGRA